TASASTVAAGTPVTLTWDTSNDSYDFIDELGGVRGGSVTTAPTATTTYTLNATNQYGRSTAQVTVTVK
ncbi:MAG: flagellar motor protein MotB, partial [Bryobacteraceae bacterium]